MIENYMKSFGLSIIICALGWAKKSNLYSGNQPGEKFFITYLPAQSNVNRIYIFCLKKTTSICCKVSASGGGGWGVGPGGNPPTTPLPKKFSCLLMPPPLFCPQNDDFVIFMQFLSNMALSHKSTTTTSLMENPLLSTFNSGDPVVNSSWLLL